MEKNYVVMTDSSADLNPALEQELGVDIIPLSVNCGDRTFLDYPDEREIKTSEFYGMLRSGANAKTAAANVETFLTAMSRHLEQGKDVLYLGFSSGLSSTYSASEIAAQELRERYPERKVLTLAILAGTGMETQAMQMVQDFNQSGTELRIEATVYSEEQAENTLDFLRTQIMAGDAPDLFCFVNSGYDERPIAPRKVCMDLLSLPDFEVSPDELLPGLYDALTQNGMLYEFPLTVTLETFLAPSNLIAEPGVTTQDLEAARQKAGEDFVPFESWNTPDNLFWLSIPFYLSKYDDRETGTCSFETQEFYDFLLWCKTGGGDVSPRNTDEKAILHYQQLSYVDQVCGMSLMAKEYLDYPDSYTYAGIPNEDTCGTMMSVTLSLGVSGSCRNETGAAEFLTFCRGYELRGLPADMVRLQAEIDAQRATGQEDEMDVRNVISPEDAEKFYALLEEKPTLRNQDDALVDILCEEAAPYFAGDVDEKTAAKTMQARTKLLLLEQAG